MIRLWVRLVVRLRYLVVAGWLAAAVASVLFLPGLGGSEPAELGGLVPADARALAVERHSFEYFDVPLLSRAVVVQRDSDGLSAAEQRRVLDRALRINTRQDELLSTVLFALPILNTGGVFPSSRERGTTAVTYLFYEPSASLHARAALADTYASRIESDGDALIGVTGAAPARIEQLEAIEGALPLVELATVLLIALVVGITFRSLGAPLLTLATAAIAYLVAIGVIGWFGETFGLAIPREVEPVMVVLLLGVVTDYAIFFLSGFRRRLAEDKSTLEAASETTRLVSPIVATAGLIVVCGTATLLVGRLEFFRAFGPGAALAVLVALVASLTLVPAALAIFGRLLFWPSLRRTSLDEGNRRGISSLLASAVSRRPVALVVALASIGLLGAAAAEARDAKLGFTLLTGLPAGSDVERALFAAGTGFEAGIVAPTMILVEGEGIGARRDQLVELEERIERQPGVAGVIGPRELPEGVPRDVLLAPDAARYAVILAGDPLGGSALEHVRTLQANLPGLLRTSGLPEAGAGLAGDTALAAETVDSIVEDIKRIALAALLVNFLFLALFLRALVAPFYLLAASVLGLVAALGVTTLVFRELLGYGDITYYVPFAGAVLLLSLGSDYNLFVVGRIWQESARRPTREAIRVAAPRASGAITIAGVALAGSFALLALVPLRPFRELALLMATGILIDTFLVRTLLVPSLIALFGEKGWWPGRRRPHVAGHG